MELKRHLKRLASAAAVLAVSSLMPMSGGMLEIPKTVLTASAATFDDINADEVFLQQGIGWIQSA